jgi:D-sedoheptulose 7-phosphate isomerase
MNLLERIELNFSESIATQQASLSTLQNSIALAAQMMTHCLLAGGRLLTCGSGSSITDAETFSSQMLYRFQTERPGLPAMSLTSANVIAAMTAAGQAERAYAQQVQTLGQQGDILLAICQDGQSANVIEAVKSAHERGLHIIALSGASGGELALHLSPEDIELRIPSQSAARIVETHRLVLHCLCDLIDHQLLGG